VSIFVEFAVLGIVAGSITSLLAMGLVVAYRGSRVINFAQGAIAMVAAFVFYSLHVTHGQSFVLSFVVGVGVAALISLAMHFFVIDRLRNAPQLMKLIATLAVLELLTQWETIKAPPITEYVPSSLPTRPVKVLSASVPEGQLWILGIVVVLAIALGLVYRYTQLGRATTAALDNRRALSALGFSPSWVGAVNWLLSGCLSGVAGILLAPISGLSVATYSLLVLPALAAVVLGRFTSITWAVVGGLGIGLIQSEMGYYIKTQGWSDAAPFLLLIVILAVRGVGQVARSAPAQRLARVGSGVIKPKVAIPVIIVALAIALLVQNQFWLGAIVVTAGSAIVLLSFVVITGYSGQLSLAQFAFAGLGAWIAGQLVASVHMPLLPAILIGVVGVAPIGILVGAICLRTTGVNLAIVTLGFAAAVEYLIFDSSTFTGISGIQIGNIELFGLNVSAISEPNRYTVLALIALIIAAIITANVRRGVAGRRLLAIRANERAASSLGIDVPRAKLFAFTLGSMLAALGGIVIGFGNSTIIFSTFSTIPSIEGVSQAILGGVGWIPGAVIGGFIQTSGIFSQALNSWVGESYVAYVPLAAAALLLIVIANQPDGAAPIMAGQLHWVATKLRLAKPVNTSEPSSKTASQRPAEAAEVRVAPMSLRVRNLTVTFGGTVAVDGLSLEVNPGEIVGLIGPNGAGKSTAIDAITGYVQYRADEVILGDESLTHLSPSARARAGVRRSFQSLELFDDLSVRDNLAIATDPAGSGQFVTGLLKPRQIAINSVTWAAIDAFKLTDSLDLYPGELSYGTRRLLAIARAAAAGPSILMLDEPAAGLDDAERLELSAALINLSQTWGIGVLLVEHDVPMVMRTCQRIYALDLGKAIASGTPAEVRDDPHVVAAFLGPEAAESAESPVVPDHLAVGSRPLAAGAAGESVGAKTAGGAQQ
jgi:ABC-type branched-subunit amino acid transport system ATPase component/branched-subunit amino acid ABC-type transport system permease component